MKQRHVLWAALLAASAFSVQSAHAVNWVGSADYTAAPNSGADEEVVGPFSTYDFGSGVVLLSVTGVSGPTTSYNGYYQSYVTKHELNGNPVSAPLLDTNYELTVVASFTQSVTGAAITVNSGGTFNVYLDTTRDRDFTTDSGFTNGDLIMSGTILSGIGTAISSGGMVFGVTDITIDVTSYDTNVFSPDTIAGGDGIFTLRLGVPSDATFLGSVPSVQGVGVTGNYLYAADGYATLAVPEAETYAMMLAGLGLVGFMARRRARANA